MNIKQALKYKNKLVSKMNGEFDKASTYNSVEVGTVKPYSADNELSFYYRSWYVRAEIYFQNVLVL